MQVLCTKNSPSGKSFARTTSLIGLSRRSNSVPCRRGGGRCGRFRRGLVGNELLQRRQFEIEVECRGLKNRNPHRVARFDWRLWWIFCISHRLQVDFLPGVIGGTNHRVAGPAAETCPGDGEENSNECPDPQCDQKFVFAGKEIPPTTSGLKGATFPSCGDA